MSAGPAGVPARDPDAKWAAFLGTWLVEGDAYTVRASSAGGLEATGPGGQPINPAWVVSRGRKAEAAEADDRA